MKKQNCKILIVLFQLSFIKQISFIILNPEIHESLIIWQG